MFPIPRRHSHYVFAILQSGLTSLVASGVASLPLAGSGTFLPNWMWSWLTAWAVMLPIVTLAAPAIRRAALALTRE